MRPAAALDLFSRRVVGWAMRTTTNAELVAVGLMMTHCRRGKPQALMQHSDRGSQYTSDQFPRLIADHGVARSMRRTACYWENAATESFFSSLKTDRTARKTFRMRANAKAEVLDCLERRHNPQRRHSKLGYLSPAAYEGDADRG